LGDWLASEANAHLVRLETNRKLKEAIRLYRGAGYVEVEAFNAEPYAHYWFEKRLERSSRFLSKKELARLVIQTETKM
jgi:hypothetical protein